MASPLTLVLKQSTTTAIGKLSQLRLGKIGFEVSLGLSGSNKNGDFLQPSSFVLVNLGDFVVGSGLDLGSGINLYLCPQK